MNTRHAELNTYKQYVAEEIEGMRVEYTMHMNRATKKRDVKMFAKFIADLDHEEEKIQIRLVLNEFQTLSDFDRQNDLVAELTAMGYKGYYTQNEVVLF